MKSFDEIIAKFLEEVEAGQRPDRSSYLAEYPEWKDDLAAFFDSHDELSHLLDEEQVSETPDPKSKTKGQIETNDADSTLGWKGGDSSTSDGSLSGTNVKQVGSYEILDEIDRGGMGIVFRARDVNLNRTVALKMIRSGRLASSSDVQRFKAEAKAAAKLDHPGIVSVYDVGSHDGHPYFSMAFIEGENLESFREKNDVSVELACQFVKEIATAMQHAHENGLVHRDLKPANILVDASGRPRITDFGLAKTLDSDEGLTGTGEILGTINFMAPEQAAAKNDQVSNATDIYSMGAILFYLCTGKPPFETDNPVDTLLKILDSEPSMLHKVNKEIPKELSLICMKCLEKDPRSRYQSADDLATDLGRFLVGEPVEAAKTGMQSRFYRWSRREPSLVGHLVGLTVIETTRLVSYAIEVAFFGGILKDYLRFTYILLAWAVACWILQKLYNRAKESEIVKYLWAGMDIGFLTVILTMADHDIGPLYIAYPLVIVVSGLFLQVRLVVFATSTCLISFAYVYIRTTDMPEYGHYGVVGIAAIVSIGFVVGVLAHRIRILNRLFDPRSR